ncbi:MAG: ATP-binding domain-containing protein, partial [Defluviitaleaceae bacterium]|nr:ATP-binding domain-containing protein [Defluviitaleaceae bacterium]
SGPPMLLTRNLLYTGLTRAKKLAVFVGTESMLQKMIDNNKEIGRNSFLSMRLQKISEILK